MNKRVSVICCYNSQDQFDAFSESLNSQSEQVNLIGINNFGNKFSSCAAAYNSVLDIIDTKFVIFSHQDIRFLSEKDITRFTDYLDRLAPYDILGVAGAYTEGQHKVPISNIYHRNMGEFACAHKVKQEIVECETIDECFFGGWTESFKKYPFDERTCDSWHLYAVDWCLAARLRNSHVFVCDLTLFHISPGVKNREFSVGVFNLCKKHAGKYSHISTTCVYSKTSLPGRIGYFIFMEEKRFIKRLLTMLGLFPFKK